MRLIDRVETLRPSRALNLSAIISRVTLLLGLSRFNSASTVLIIALVISRGRPPG
jgi:hypothetical protein